MRQTIKCGLIIIGNEILSGRTQDINLSYISKNLTTIGLEICEVRIIPDIEDMIIEAINTLRLKYFYVFTTGGIGNTHDDITTACVAKAFNKRLIENAEVMAIVKNLYKDAINEACKRQALMPEEAKLISNPVSDIPSFYINNVYVLAGMPIVMRGMLQSLLPKLQHGSPIFTYSITCNLSENEIANELELIQQKYNDVEIGSYPFYQSWDNRGADFVLKSHDKQMLEKARQEVIKMIENKSHSV